MYKYPQLRRWSHRLLPHILHQLLIKVHDYTESRDQKYYIDSYCLYNMSRSRKISVSPIDMKIIS